MTVEKLVHLLHQGGGIASFFHGDENNSIFKKSSVLKMKSYCFTDGGLSNTRGSDHCSDSMLYYTGDDLLHFDLSSDVHISSLLK